MDSSGKKKVKRYIASAVELKEQVLAHEPNHANKGSKKDKKFWAGELERLGILGKQHTLGSTQTWPDPALVVQSHPLYTLQTGDTANDSAPVHSATFDAGGVARALRPAARTGADEAAPGGGAEVFSLAADVEFNFVGCE